MKGSSIGECSWNSSDSNNNSGYGVNEWSDAALMKLLNSGYDSLSVGGSLYWNSKSGTCYNGSKNATKSCDFTSTGLKNDRTRNLISEVTYNLGGWNTNEIYPNQIYEYERGATVYTGRSTTWTGKVSIPYPSDYGYAADLNLCKQKLDSYDNSTCTENNWMDNILGTYREGWLLTHDSMSADRVWYVNGDGRVDGGNIAYTTIGVAPTLFLDESIGISGGDGSESNPYTLDV